MKLIEMVIRYENGNMVYIEKGTDTREVELEGIVGIAVFDKNINADVLKWITDKLFMLKLKITFKGETEA